MIIPNYYCPHCGRFKKWFQVEWEEMFCAHYCKHCGYRLIDVRDFLEAEVRKMYEREGKNDKDSSK